MGEPYTEFTLIESFDFHFNNPISIEYYVEKIKFKYPNHFVNYEKHELLLSSQDYNYTTVYHNYKSEEYKQLTNIVNCYTIVIQFRLKSKLKHKLDQI